MDRNNLSTPTSQTNSRVALRKESVDRNSTGSASIRAYIVALRKESVDRNLQEVMIMSTLTVASLSARRAWIEIIRVL